MSSPETDRTTANQGDRPTSDSKEPLSTPLKPLFIIVLVLLAVLIFGALDR